MITPSTEWAPAGWLRSPGDRSKYAAYVFSDGYVISLGNLVNVEYGGVRPVVVALP